MLHCSHFPKAAWAAWYVTRLLVKLTPKGVVSSFLFLPKAETAASAFAMHVGVDMIVTIIVFTIVVVIAMIPVNINNNNTDNYGDDEDDDKQTKRPDVTELALAE